LTLSLRLKNSIREFNHSAIISIQFNNTYSLRYSVHLHYHYLLNRGGQYRVQLYRGAFENLYLLPVPRYFFMHCIRYFERYNNILRDLLRL